MIHLVSKHYGVKNEVEVFELRMIHNMDYKQIATIMNSSKSSIARMLQNIIKKIKAEFDEKS